MGRPVVPEYSDEKIVSTGLSLIKPGARPLTVSAYKIQKALKGGNYSRIARVWGAYLDSLGHDVDGVDLPPDLQSKLDTIAADLQVKLQGLVADSYGVLLSQFQRREYELRAKFDDQVSYHRQQAQEALQVADGLERELDTSASVLAEARAVNEGLSRDLANLSVQLREVSSEADQLKSKYFSLSTTVVELRTALEAKDAELQSARVREGTLVGKLETLEGVYQDCVASIDAKAATIQTLEATVARYQGFRSSVKELLASHGIKPPAWPDPER